MEEKKEKELMCTNKFCYVHKVLQIIPEEEALLEIFGEEYEEYKKNVRRWI